MASCAESILKKYHPRVIGITGSIGKTSAKEAIYAVLNTKFNVRENKKNYNNEIGVPLTVIDAESGGNSILGWMKVFRKAIKLIYGENKNYPEILIMEMGADKPGDIEYLVNIAPCNIGVVTTIGPTHLQAFGTVEKVAREKQKIVSHLNKDGVAILNYDDLLVRKMAEKTKAKVVFFGYSEKADIHSVDLANHGVTMDLQGIKFKISDGRSSVPVFLPGVVGIHQINSALIAAAVGNSLGMNLIDVSIGLKNYRAPKGRMNLIEGIENSLMIDDTYNSSPKAAAAALETLAKLNISDARRKVAILGDMLELGTFSEQAHYELGKSVADLKIDFLICAGNMRHKIVQGAMENGFSGDNIVEFRDSVEAGQTVRNLIKSNELILVKGSQGARMELIVKALMRNPEDAKKLLVRQTGEWIKS